MEGINSSWLIAHSKTLKTMSHELKYSDGGEESPDILKVCSIGKMALIFTPLDSEHLTGFTLQLFYFIPESSCLFKIFPSDSFF